MFKIISEQVDFNNRGLLAVRQNEVFAPSLPIQTGYFGDFGCRLRYNVFHRQDMWWSGKVNENPFFDYIFYSADIYETFAERTELAEFWFRLDVNQIVHKRIVFSFMDFVGALGGVPGFLLKMGSLVVGGFSAFYASISTVAVLY